MAQMAFLLVTALFAYFIYRRFTLIKLAINLGKPADFSDNKPERIKTMLLIAFGQKKMFDRPIVGFLHLVIYLGFVIINIELLEIVLDGLTGQHRLFFPIIGSGLYSFLINSFEWLAFGVLAVCVVFLIRRNVLAIKRFRQPELNGWPAKDANTILIYECVLMWLFLSMNAADANLQALADPHYPLTGSFVISKFIQPIVNFGGNAEAIHIYERTAWWLHIIGIFGFALYLSWSKHLHVILAFPNVYFSRLKPAGEINNMPVISYEVKSMLGLSVEGMPAPPTEPGRFGAKDVTDLTWKNIMEAYSCTECGRCTSACPANITGKLLSPRKIMMDTRDRAQEVAELVYVGEKPNSDKKSLYQDYITKEELMACTTCNACVDACPININPLEIILEMRRYVALEESATPASWNSMFQNVENNAAPWAFPPSDRANWTEKVNG
jgi:ferredoxin